MTREHLIERLAAAMLQGATREAAVVLPVDWDLELARRAVAFLEAEGLLREP